MANLNEESLLSYLKEELLKTQSQYLTEVEVKDYWVDGKYRKDFGMNITDEQVDFFITNCDNRMKPLMFRIKWLEGQIEEITMLNIFKLRDE
jgi:hypothetical protein